MNAEEIAANPTETYKYLSMEEYVAGVNQMLLDLERMASQDGCIAAGWALDFLENLKEFTVR